MSLDTWTPAALSSETRPLQALGWRIVEAEHRVSTLKLVDSLAEQALLEDILEAAKPALPVDCAGLDYLLATPFRYRPYPQGSRFRRAGLTPGVWYGAETPATAAAEMVFYRYLFYAESPGTPFPDGTADYTAFSVRIVTDRALDLTAPPLDTDALLWSHPVDYLACQTLAERARDIGAGVIRYRSVRDPGGGANLAVLTCAAFAARAPQDHQTWRIRIGRNGAQAICDHPRLGMEFATDAFAHDPRLQAMDWDRRPRR
jgi:hypothetical protein